MPPAEYHATLGPSAAKRWINCPASVSLGAGVEKTTSKYAEAGRTAHELAELKARKRFTPMNKRTYTSQLKKIQAGEFYASEMEGYTDLYVEVLEQHAMSFAAPPFIALETAVPIGAYTSELKPDGSPATGTADCIQIGGDTLWITDYKNGSGVPVDADHNPQMQLYALGALQLYAPVYGDMIRTVRMTIVQPALKSVSDFEIGRAELEAWGREVVIPAAARATSADPGAPCPGEWCRFCPVEHTCRARAEKNLALEAFGFAQPASGEQVVAGDTRLLTDAEIGDILRRGADLLAWYSGLKDYALQACLDGREITGFILAMHLKRCLQLPRIRSRQLQSILATRLRRLPQPIPHRSSTPLIPSPDSPCRPACPSWVSDLRGPFGPLHQGGRHASSFY